MTLIPQMNEEIFLLNLNFILPKLTLYNSVKQVLSLCGIEPVGISTGKILSQ